MDRRRGQEMVVSSHLEEGRLQSNVGSDVETLVVGFSLRARILRAGLKEGCGRQQDRNTAELKTVK